MAKYTAGYTYYMSPIKPKPKKKIKWPYRIDLVNPNGDRCFVGYASKLKGGADIRIKNLRKILPESWQVRLCFRDMWTGNVTKVVPFNGTLPGQTVYKDRIVDRKHIKRSKAKRHGMPPVYFQGSIRGS